MKSILRFIIAVIAIFIASHPLFAQWTQTDLTTADVRCFTESGTNLFAGTWGDGVYLSTNYGTSWVQIDSGLTNPNVRSLAIKDTNLFAGTWGGGVYLSTNNGLNWTQVIFGLQNPYVLCFCVTDTNIFAGIDGGGVFRTANYGVSWVNVGLLSYYVPALTYLSGTLYAGTTSGIYRTSDIGNTWIPINNGLTSVSVYSLAFKGTNLFAGIINGGIFVTTDFGTNWNQTGLTGASVYSIVVYNDNIFASTNNGVFLSTNEGVSWTQVSDGLTNTNIRSLIISGINLFAGTFGAGVWRRQLSEMVTSVEYISGELPEHFSLEQNYPNPFNPNTKICWQSPENCWHTLRVYDILGKEVATLVDEYKSAGSYEIEFNAANLSSGVYYYQLQTSSSLLSKKMVLLK